MYAIVSQYQQWYNDIYKAYFPHLFSDKHPCNMAITVLIPILELGQGL